MKFSKGDKVLIRQHTKEEKERYPFGWMPWRMNTFEGNVGTISNCGLSDGKPCYCVVCDSCEAFFVESSLSIIGYEQF